MSSNAHAAGSHADSDRSEEQDEIGVEHNPNGPWANLENKHLQDAILRLAGQHHAACAAENPKLSKFADFLDAFASAWLEQKAQVEEEAQKYGFTLCNSTAEIPAEDRHKAALLMLTLNGSFVLLGNGCLVPAGSSGRYTKIPFRKGEGVTHIHAPFGIVVPGEAQMQRRLVLENRSPFISNTSPLQALYYTDKDLPAEDALELGEALSMSVGRFAQTIRGDMDETLRKDSPEDPNRHGVEAPDQPVFEPMH